VLLKRQHLFVLSHDTRASRSDAGTTGGTSADVEKSLARLSRLDVERIMEASDDELRSARTAFMSLAARATPDVHRAGRTRARIGLAMFVSAHLLDIANRPVK
jgi:hypothetical protein